MGGGESSTGRTLRVGVLGCGNVGGAFVQLIDDDVAQIARRSGLLLEVTRVAVRDLEKERAPGLDRAALSKRLTTDARSVVEDPDVDVVVELIGGVEPARELVLAALKSGKPVVSGNKELIAAGGRELLEAAEQAGVDFLFEAAVGGAIPLVRLLRESLAGERVVRLTGIVNGTTNYILTRMSEDGLGYEAALESAKALGYAEADPSADVEGYDAAAKAAILAGIAFSADVVASDVHREGISSIGAGDVELARRLGYEVKLLAVCEAEPACAPGGDAGTSSPHARPAEAVPRVAVRVHPAMVPRDHPLASVRDSFNAVFVEGASAGELMVYGQGAGGLPTASAVLGDVIDAAHHLRDGSRARPAHRHACALRPMSELRTQYYLSMEVADRPGVLAAVASVFGRNNVSIRSMEQVGLGAEAGLVFITHTALEADVQATISELGLLGAVERIRCLLRLIGPEPAAGP
ncbi:MAG: homoserine dehydrogenase [Acidimicrobiales bacterium]